jgi:hypothetical protein
MDYRNNAIALSFRFRFQDTTVTHEHYLQASLKLPTTLQNKLLPPAPITRRGTYSKGSSEPSLSRQLIQARGVFEIKPRPNVTNHINNVRMPTASGIF